MKITDLIWFWAKTQRHLTFKVTVGEKVHEFPTYNEAMTVYWEIKVMKIATDFYVYKKGILHDTLTAIYRHQTDPARWEK